MGRNSITIAGNQSFIAMQTRAVSMPWREWHWGCSRSEASSCFQAVAELASRPRRGVVIVKCDIRLERGNDRSRFTSFDQLEIVLCADDDASPSEIGSGDGIVVVTCARDDKLWAVAALEQLQEGVMEGSVSIGTTDRMWLWGDGSAPISLRRS